MTSEELEKCTDYQAVLRSEMKARTGPMAGYVERVRRAVFDDRLAEYWPECRVHVIWCEYSPWPMAETAWTFEKLKEACVKEGTKGRRLTVEMMPAANHFVSGMNLRRIHCTLIADRSHIGRSPSRSSPFLLRQWRPNDDLVKMRMIMKLSSLLETMYHVLGGGSADLAG